MTPLEAIEAIRNGEKHVVLSSEFDGSTWEEFCEVHREKYETGDGEYLFLMLLSCGQKWSVPQWAANALLNSYFSYLSGEMRELGEAFAIQRPKGWNQNARQKKVRNFSSFCIRMAQLLNEGRVLDAALREVSDALGISHSTARDLYYADGRPEIEKIRCMLATLTTSRSEGGSD
jgi:hypothetical protein